MTAPDDPSNQDPFATPGKAKGFLKHQPASSLTLKATQKKTTPMSTASRKAVLPGHRQRLTVQVTGCDDDLTQSVQSAARRAMQSQNYHHGQLDIAVIGESEMRRMHAKWKGRASVTDVLAFDLRETCDAGSVDGQILVCKSVARRRARSRKSDWKAELLLYVVHGCLHLCGYDDQDKAAAAKMHEREDQILTALGWGPVF